MQVPAFILDTLEQALDRVLHLDPEALAQLGMLTGKVVAVHLRDMDLRVYMLPHAEGIHLSAHYDEAPDAEVSAAPFTLLRLLATRDSAMLSNGEVDLQGDTASARRLTEILQNLEIDWEEQSAQVFGDIPARWLGNLVRRGTAWGKAQGEAVQSNVSEYAREELRILPADEEVTAFMDDVDDLRADCDRLEQRIKRLERMPVKA